MPFGVLLLTVLLAAGLRLADANPAAAQTAALTAWRVDTDPGLDGTAAIWRRVPGTEVALNEQTATYPTGGSFGYRLQPPTVVARALHFDDALYVSIHWRDGTVDAGSGRPEDYSDAAAIQFPSEPGSTVPAVCMGQADQAVNIWQWRADSQEGIPTIPPEGYVDLYPSDDELFYPARSAGNPYATVDAGPVQNLVAGGFGTLAPASEQVVDGHGTRDGDGWTAVFKRSYRAPGAFQPTFAEGQRIDVAFAAWNGMLDHRNGTKSVTSFLRLDLSSEGPPSRSPILPIVGWALLALLLAGTFTAIATGPRGAERTGR